MHYPSGVGCLNLQITMQRISITKNWRCPVDSVVHLLNNWLMLIESFKYYFSYISCLFEIHVVYSGLHLNSKVSRSQMLLTIHLKDL